MVDRINIEQCCAAHILLINNIVTIVSINQAQQCWTILLTMSNIVDSTTLCNPVFINSEEIDHFLLQPTHIPWNLSCTLDVVFWCCSLGTRLEDLITKF